MLTDLKGNIETSNQGSLNGNFSNLVKFCFLVFYVLNWIEKLNKYLPNPHQFSTSTVKIKSPTNPKRWFTTQDSMTQTFQTMFSSIFSLFEVRNKLTNPSKDIANFDYQHCGIHPFQPTLIPPLRQIGITSAILKLDISPTISYIIWNYIPTTKWISINHWWGQWSNIRWKWEEPTVKTMQQKLEANMLEMTDILGLDTLLSSLCSSCWWVWHFFSLNCSRNKC